MGWKEYFLAALILNICQMAIAFVILMNQKVLPLNPQGFPGLSWDLAFNTVVSFATNTNLQHYAGEATLSYFSQMTAIQFLQFTSAATGICCGIAMVRGFVVHSKDLGNFYVDFVRSLTRLFVPLCLIAAIVFVGLGVPQTLSGYTTVKTIEGATQSILVGPVASLVAIMQLGTNGGGYYRRKFGLSFSESKPGFGCVRNFSNASHSHCALFCIRRIHRKETRKYTHHSWRVRPLHDRSRDCIRPDSDPQWTGS